jgi:uncharacterized protein (TIGR02001 family)
MRQLTKLSLVAAALSSTLFVSQSALAEVSANVGVTSDYVWRGVSQSGDAASVSGGLDYANESGFYAGVWAGSLATGNGAETDFYAGFSGETDTFTYDVGYIYYVYTDNDLSGSDFGEFYFNGGVGNFGFGLAYTINSDVDEGSAFDAGDIYYSLSYGGIDLGNEFELSLTAGLYTFDADGGENDFDYSHVQADISKGDFTFSISQAAESDLATDELKLMASWSASF